MADRLGYMGSMSDPRFGGSMKGLGKVEKKAGTKPVFSPYQIAETPDELKKIAEQAKLYSEALPPNLAKDPEVAKRCRMAIEATMNSVFNVMEFLRNKWLILYRLYRGETLAQFAYGRVALHSPEPFKAIETMHPRLYRSIFGIEPWFMIQGQEQRDDAPAKHQTALCRAQMMDMKYEVTARMLMREFLIYGTAIQKTYWRREQQTVHYRQAQRAPDPNRPGQTILRLRKVEREEYTFDGNDIRPVSIFDFFSSPTASSIDRSEWCADRALIPDYEVRQMGQLGLWENLDELEYSMGELSQNFGDEFKERKAYSYGVFDSRQASVAPHVGHRQAIDWFGPVDLEGTGTEVMCHITMLEPRKHRTIVLARELPFWHKEKPYQVARYISLEGELFGIGVLEPAARLSMEIDTKRNVGMAAAQLESNPMLVVGDGANIPDGQLVAQPGLVLRAENADDIKPLFLPKVSDAANQAEDRLKADFRETTGTTPPLLGTSVGGTATQDQNNLNESNTRVSGGVKSWELEIMIPMLNQMCWNNQQFMSRERVLNVIGPMGLKFEDRYMIKPEHIAGRFVYTPLASYQLSSRITQTQQLINLLDRAPAINQLAGPETIRIPQLVAKIFREGFGFQDVATFISLPASDAGFLTPTEEHELWYHGEVAPVKSNENHLRHFVAHMAELKTDSFQMLEKREPATAARARTHAAQHALELERVGLTQEQALMQQAQQGAMQAAGMGGGDQGQQGGTEPTMPAATQPGGFGGPGQQPGSPGFRGSSGPESGMPKSPNGATKSAAGMQAPNAGAT